MKTFQISKKPLDFKTLEKTIKYKYQLTLSEDSKNRITKCRKYLDKKIKSQDEPIYGITTGFGSLCDHSISKEDLSQLQINLIKSHACGIGNEIPHNIEKLMLLLKAYALSLGNSGVKLDTVERILDFYNNDILPVVYEQGSLGASGDLAPLAHLFLPLLGLGEVNYKGKRYTGDEILKKFNWQPIQLQSKEGLALLNGTQFMSSYGVIILIKALKLSKLADIIGAISLDAYDGRIEPFLDIIQQVRPHKGQIKTAKNFRQILKGSELIKNSTKQVQDPYSFRCIPQVHGASKDAINYVANVFLTEINSVTDNPTIFPDEDLIISGGNFHGQPLAISFDFLSIALSELGNISERRIYRLISGQRGLPAFLIANPGLNSGFMLPQYTAASIVSQNKQLCTPASVDSISSSNEQEDHVSMGANAATKTLKIVNNLERILAIELFASTQALEFRRPFKTSPFLESFIYEYRKKVSFVKNDRIMYKDIKKSVDFLQEIKILMPDEN